MILHDSSRGPCRLPEWHQLEQHWMSIVQTYVRHYSNSGVVTDVPYWYNEMACTSMLAGAVWRVDGAVALQEYAAIKDTYSGGDKYIGRADLWLRFKGASHGYIVEAKIVWPTSADSTKVVVDEALSRAVADAHAHRSGADGDVPVGVVFVVPSLAESTSEEAAKKELEAAHIALEKTEHDFFVSTFPAEAWRISSPRTRRWYPGVAVIARCASCR